MSHRLTVDRLGCEHRCGGPELHRQQLPTQFFPKDLQYLSWVDVWLPEDAPLAATQQATAEAEAIVLEVAGDKLKSLTTFVGGGSPRFWISASPEQSQLNYAQILMEMKDKHDTIHLSESLQHALSERVAGARLDVRLLEVGSAVGIPLQIRVSGEDMPTLRGLAADVTNAFRSIPTAIRIRDTWGPESFTVQLKTDPERANISGLTNIEIAGASATAMNGARMTVLREGDKQIPVVAQMRGEERAEFADIRNRYAYSTKGRQKVPLESVTTIDYGMHTEKLQRGHQFRTITISAFPSANVLASEVLNEAMPKLRAIEQSMPPGYRMEIGGEYEEQTHAEGKPLEEALLDAGIARLRPVLITVAATVIALFPLAAHGGPRWEPMCYTQIGGLTVATFVTLLVVPVIYATFVLDLKLVKWETAK